MNPATLKQIKNLNIDSEKPLLIFDADEVLVLFASHFSQFLNKRGWRLNLKGYRLDDAIEHIEQGHVADKVTYQNLIDHFIDKETSNQPEATGASASLRKFKNYAEIIILTNVPHRAYSKRIKNLSALKMNYPTVSNSGLKGPALQEISKLTQNICVFIDDNPFQIASAAKFTPHIHRFHFSACDLVKTTMPYSEEATHRPSSWHELNQLINQLLGLA